VLAVFLELAARDNVAIKRIADRLEPIGHLGTEVELTYSVQLMDLLPSNTDNFYRYKGSLVLKPLCKIRSMINNYTNIFLRRHLVAMKW